MTFYIDNHISLYLEYYVNIVYSKVLDFIMIKTTFT